MPAIASVFYGLVTYALFLTTILYLIAFVGDFPVPKTINTGEAAPLVTGVIIDTMLLALFALQHSVMARPGFKRWWTRFVPEAVERTTYVLLASLIMVALFWFWRPIPQPVWIVENPVAVAALNALFWLGWGLLFLSTFLINHFELFGLRQVYARLRGRSLPEPVFRTPFLYKRTRHPLYLGFLIAFWATPFMTVGHLLFALATTAYIFLGIYFEERDLVALFGDQYRRYREQVSMLIPLPWRKSAPLRDGGTSIETAAGQ